MDNTFNNRVYNPFPDLPEVFTGSTSLVYVISSGNEELTVSFGDNGKLDEKSVSIRETASERVKGIIDVLEQKVNNSEFIGVEDSGDDYELKEDNDPFDPSTISIEKKTISMDTITRRLCQGTFILNPGFQRKEVWDDNRKCKLIESLLLKIPIPMFYVAADNSDRWTVVDGLQRLSTIRDFVLGSRFMETKDESLRGKGLVLDGLDFCGKTLNGLTMSQLPTVFVNRIMETEFTFTIINPGTPEDVKRNVFKRINTGGMMLSPQEIRNALYGGVSSELLNKLAAMDVFKRATCWSVKEERMGDRELILRFVSFLIRDRNTYSRTQSIDDWLCDTMLLLNNRNNLNTREINKLVKENRVSINDVKCLSDDEIERLFILAMERSRQLFENHAFRKSIYPNRRAPVNKALFESWSILLSQLTDSEFADVMNHKQSLLSDYTDYLYNNDEFVIAISRDSMNKNSVSYRYNSLSELIDKYK